MSCFTRCAVGVVRRDGDMWWRQGIVTCGGAFITIHTNIVLATWVVLATSVVLVTWVVLATSVVLATWVVLATRVVG